MKLALGTVQFGLDYGAFGKGTQLHEHEVASVIALAQKAGIRLLDTANAYGSSEALLGNLGAPQRFQIVTKCPRLPEQGNAGQALLDAFARSCQTLGVDAVWGYLLHHAADLRREGVWPALQHLVETGRVDRIGVSAYCHEEALQLCEEHPLTLVQLPANVLTPWYRSAAFPPRVEVHARSVFLQGFLLSDPDRLPPPFARWKNTLQTFRARAAARGLTPLQAAIGPLIQAPGIHQIVIGVDSRDQLQHILDSVGELAGHAAMDLGDFPDASAELTDPRNWA